MSDGAWDLWTGRGAALGGKHSRTALIGEDARCGHVHAHEIDIGKAYRGFFAPLARDGAGLLEVQAVLQDTLSMLAEAGDGPAATEAREALDRSLAALTRNRERRLLKEAAAWLR